MRAAVLTSHGLDGVLIAERDEPRPAAGELAVRVETVGVNQLDLNVIAGHGPGAAAKLPRVLGLDPAGTVVSVGEGVDPARGRRAGRREAEHLLRLVPSLLGRPGGRLPGAVRRGRAPRRRRGRGRHRARAQRLRPGRARRRHRDGRRAQRADRAQRDRDGGRHGGRPRARHRRRRHARPRRRPARGAPRRRGRRRVPFRSRDSGRGPGHPGRRIPRASRRRSRRRSPTVAASTSWST